MTKKKSDQNNVQLDQEQPDETVYLKELEIFSIKQLLLKAKARLKLYQRALDCAISNRNSAAIRLENAHAIQPVNSFESNNAIHYATIEYQLRVKELDLASDKVLGVNSYIDDLKEQIDHINGKQNIRELHEDLISDLQRRFLTTSNTRPKIVF